MIGLDLRRPVWPDDDYRPLIRFTWPDRDVGPPLASPSRAREAIGAGRVCVEASAPQLLAIVAQLNPAVSR